LAQAHEPQRIGHCGLLSHGLARFTAHTLAQTNS
jgi:hypothetical protein